MNRYELIYILNENVKEDEVAKISEKIKKIIKELKGKVTSEQNLGRRKLAYRIKKNEFGTYMTEIFELEAEKLENLEKELKLISQITRHLIAKLAKVEKPEPPKFEKPIKKKAKPVKEIEKVKKPKPTKIKKIAPTKEEKPALVSEMETEEERLKKLEEKLGEILKE